MSMIRLLLVWVYWAMAFLSPDAYALQLTRTAFVAVLAGGVVLLAVAVGTAALARFGEAFFLGTFVSYLPAAAVIVARIASYHPHARFGLANVITLVRLIITSLLAGLAVELFMSQGRMTFNSAWYFFAAAVVGLVLDGLDGPVARREELTSRFGSRFDMEADALQSFVLSVVAFVLAKAGWWILIGGLLRYLFVAVSVVWPTLAGALPPSWRRKTISAIQSSVLVALLAPIIVPPLSTIAATTALLLLVYSFTVDVVWLVGERGRTQ
jgi:phosphatidylglycerophosphate synthase